MTTLVVALAPASSASADEPRDRFGYGLLPAIAFDADTGFGAGAIARLYRYADGIKPYQYSIGLLAYVTTGGVHDHAMQFDVPALMNRRLRVRGRVGFNANSADRYCGLASEASCAVAEAEAAADSANLTGDARDDFLDRYYEFPYVRPDMSIIGLWRVAPGSPVELFASWRGAYWKIRRLDRDGPYPGSLYEQNFGAGESGIASEAQLGVSVDRRDVEAAPTRGYWLEASARGAARVIGSDWNTAGFNLTARGYRRLGSPRLVLAARGVFDGVFGNPPVQEMALMGGQSNYPAFGGQKMGRGVRAHRYLGKVRIMEQTELRATVYQRGSPRPIAITVVGFGDAGYVADDWGGDGAFAYGVGGGLRLAWDTNFIIRVDVGVSPKEGWSPAVYVDIDNLF